MKYFIMILLITTSGCVKINLISTDKCMLPEGCPTEHPQGKVKFPNNNDGR